MMTATATKMSLENKHLHNCEYFCDYPILFAFYNVGEQPYDWIGLSAVKLNTQN